MTQKRADGYLRRTGARSTSLTQLHASSPTEPSASPTPTRGSTTTRSSTFAKPSPWPSTTKTTPPRPILTKILHGFGDSAGTTSEHWPDGRAAGADGGCLERLTV